MSSNTTTSFVVIHYLGLRIGRVSPHRSELRSVFWAAHTANMQAIMVLFACTICALLLLAIPTFAQATAEVVPENAHTKSYRDGWECDLGYRISGNECIAIDVPQNAFRTNRSYGAGWECRHGFKEVEGPACLEVPVPDGAFLVPSGQGWRCLRGFQEVADTCQELILPENSYLADTTFGSQWLCNRGFEAVENTCAAIVVPANAYLDTSRRGQAWTCERKFFQRAGTCEAIAIPENAYFDDATYGKGWKCVRGYAASGNSCKAIEMPDNAHLDRTGNDWECHRNFQKSRDRCVLNE